MRPNVAVLDIGPVLTAPIVTDAAGTDGARLLVTAGTWLGDSPPGSLQPVS